jgi:biotin carboxyl carrier protein
METGVQTEEWVVLLVSLTVMVDDTEYSVEVAEKKVIITGKEYTIEEKGDTIEVDGTPYIVEIEEGEAMVNGIPHTVSLKSDIAKTEKRVLSVPGAVTAMMPGRIVNVFVKAGDSVKAGDVLCILEAMKMENELQAPKDGTVKTVTVKAGDNVERGEVLVEVA